MKKIGIIGTGFFGTALALTATRADNEVLCWDRKEEVVDSINNQHQIPLCLPNIPLPSTIRASSNLSSVNMYPPRFVIKSYQ